MDEIEQEDVLGHRLTIIANKMSELSSKAETFSREQLGEENLQQAQLCAAKLDIVIKRFSDELNVYFKMVNRPSVDHISEVTEIQLNAEENLTELRLILEGKKNEEKKEKNGNSSDNTKGGRAYTAKLPTLTLPQFNGELLRWNEYWDIFKSNIHERPIADVDKLLYLKSTLKGEPRNVIDGLETTNKNYGIAINILQERYGKTSRIIDAHYSALRKIKTATGTINENRLVLNDIERNLRVLHSLGEDINHNHLRQLIVEKFPEDIIYEMKMKIKEESVEEMRKHLEIIISAREEASRSKLDKEETDEKVNTVETMHTTFKNTQQKNNMQARKYRRNYTERNNAEKDFVRREDNKRRNYNYRNQPYPSRNIHDNMKRNRDEMQGRNKEGRNEFKRRKISCIFCEGNHFNDKCQKYKNLTERRAQLINRCFNCLGQDHIARECKKRKICPYCSKIGHDRSLCSQRFTTEIRTNTMTTVNNDTVTVLQTAIVAVRNGKREGNPTKCRVLLDSGSQRSYITKHISKTLKLPILEENKLSIYSFANERPQDYNSNRVRIEIYTKTNKKLILHVNEIPFISKGVDPPNPNLNERTDKTLSDDGSLGARIDILIGNDYYFNLISTEKIKIKENLFLIESELGYIISGRVPAKERENTLSIITYCQHHDSKCMYYTEPDLPLKNMDIRFLWSLESIGITDSPKATREEEAVKHFNETVKYENGRYRVKWPWVQYPPELPTNFGLAFGRLKGLLQRLQENNFKEYQTIFEDQLKMGIIETIEREDNAYNQRVPPIHYLAHHMVKQEGKKGRIVYDASGKLKEGKSLNENMYRGPSMIGDLIALFIQFRTHKVGITADVEKAFLQIELQEEDRDVTRFLWIKDPQEPISTDNIIHMRFCRVPFGIIASPFILTATLKYHTSRTSPELVSSIIDKCYVDNFVTGTSSTEKAKQLYENTQKLFHTISMNMRDWISNDKPFIATVPPEQRAKNQEETKILGLIWNTEEDTLKLKIKNELLDKRVIVEPQNKRKILSTIASIYDPCGFCTPLILPIKLLLQELWNLKIKWDTSLPTDLQKKWEELAENLNEIKEVEIPRFTGINEEIDQTTYELHGFSDASKQAYGAVIYLRTENKNCVNIAFIMAKSKVVPKEEREKLHMPRLELLGCYLGNKLITYVKNIIELPISKQFLWTDSQIVLSWINSNKLLSPFIAKRINTIKENKQLEMRYINTNLNPADLATRHDMWNKKKTLWLDGPEFLKQQQQDWPKISTTIDSTSLLAEGPSDSINLMEVDDNIPEIIFQEQRETVRDENREIEIINNIQVLKNLQKEYFPQESEGKKTSLAINLDIFKDIDGILRCNGRMKNADWPFDKRHPMLIPRDCKFTEEFITKTHKENYHMGANHTLSKVRERYWIPKGKSYIQRVLKKCPECTKHNGGPFKLPPTPALPPERVNYSAPFTYVGVDYMGPLLINNGAHKRWICLFTCLVVRAVHLEVVRDLTSEEGILALRRMISTRGIPSLITSDNAQHFKLIADIISNQYCIDKKIKWRFINPLSPWTGGFYERLIGIVKNCMKKTLDKHKLTENQLATVIKEIEAVINSRPLTSVDSELDYTLKPSDFLTVGRVITLEETDKIIEHQDASTTKTELIQGWKRALKILEEFKEMFSNRYLLSLRERYNHLPREPRITTKRIPHPGQIVQIKGESKDRNSWRVGKIISLIPSVDGQCRAARVKVGTNEYVRSIAHLYPLEMNEDPNLNIINSKEKETAQQVKPVNNVDKLKDVENIEDRTSSQIPNEANEIEEITPLQNTEELEPSSQTEVNENSDIFERESNLPQNDDPQEEESNQKARRLAATKAMQKIKEWTQDLNAFLLISEASPLGSVAASASS